MPDKCKHEKAAEGATFCPDCGTEIGDAEDRFIGKIADAVFNRLNPKPKKNGGNDEPDETLLERFTKKRKKEKK